MYVFRPKNERMLYGHPVATPPCPSCWQKRISKIMEGKKFKTIGGYAFGLWGLAMHLAILWGVLDVNFHSPVLQGLPTIPPPSGAPAKRLLLFVADGLRYRTFEEDPPPYLKTVMDDHAAWGISHTRMPTESRPGHVALAAGLYEDPSAVFKGWKENPVDFDSVFNQSRMTWAWGSPDIIPIFAKGSGDRMQGGSYSADWEDFDGSPGSAIRLDSWVFDRFSDWLEKTGPQVKDWDRVILFFHLLGCDTTGHAKKPHSKAYLENMKYVDLQIGKTVQRVEDFFGNGSTAYVFTSDHGMTDWGSHGSGSTDETETPLVVWGAGVKPLKSRHDVQQADITPLISSLIGISIPSNNEGVLPRKYLTSGDEEYGLRALLSNAKQLSLQVTANRVLSGSGDAEDKHWREKKLEDGIHKAERLLEERKLEEAIYEGERVILLAKESLYHFRRYHRNLLMAFLTIAWLGWIALLFLRVTGTERYATNSTVLLWTNAGFTCTAIVLVIWYLVAGFSGWRLPCYGSLALCSLWCAARYLISHSPSLRGNEKRWAWPVVGGTILLTICMSFGLSHRWIFSIAMLCAAAMQRVLLTGGHFLLPWTAVTLAIFPLLPPVGSQPRIYLVLASLCIAGMGVLSNVKMNRLLQLLEILKLASTAVVCVGWLDARAWISWTILTSTPFFIWAHPEDPKQRVMGVALGLLSPLAMLSSSYEPLFFLVLSVHLLSWPIPRFNSRGMSFEKKPLSVQELARAAFLMLYTLLSFFGTGNLASVSSFDPSWTRHFVTTFSPFTMTALILFKLSIPLILVGCASHALAPPTLFLAALLLGDCLSLPVMHAVTTEGSWLDIGSAISRFVIAITLPCLLLLLYHLSYPLVTLKVITMPSQITEKRHSV